MSLAQQIKVPLPSFYVPPSVGDTFTIEQADDDGRHSGRYRVTAIGPVTVRAELLPSPKSEVEGG